MTDIQSLRKIAQDATPGPWESGKAGLMGDPVVIKDDGVNATILFDGISGTEADAGFIAAFNPQTVLALLDRVEKAEQEMETANEMIHQGNVSMTETLQFIREKSKESVRRRRELETRVRKAEAALQRVRELHYEEDHECVECSFESMPDVGFRGVSVPYPCPPIRALEGDE